MSIMADVILGPSAHVKFIDYIKYPEDPGWNFNWQEIKSYRTFREYYNAREDNCGYSP